MAFRDLMPDPRRQRRPSTKPRPQRPESGSPTPLIGYQALLTVDTNEEVGRQRSCTPTWAGLGRIDNSGRRGAIRGAKWSHLGWL